jgi:hypothetical protein
LKDRGSADHVRSWDTEPKGFAVAPRANIETLTIACWPSGYEIFVGDTEGTVHMSEEGGDSWTRIADEVGCVTKGNHAAVGTSRRLGGDLALGTDSNQTNELAIRKRLS